MSEFIFEDSEIPDLVLEAIIGFLAEMTPMEKWGEIRSVSKRWNRISKPVLKEAFERAWPKFAIPRNKKTAVRGGEETECHIEFNSKRDRVECTADDREHRNTLSPHIQTQRAHRPPSNAEYRWGFTEPLSLAEVKSSGKSIGVVFVPSTSGGVYVGVWIVHARSCSLLETEIVWDPDDPKDRLRPNGDMCGAVIGCYSGEVITHEIDDRKRGDNSAGHLGAHTNEPYEVSYFPGGAVSFRVNGEPHGATKIDEPTMLEKHGGNAMLVFGVAMDSRRTATLKARTQGTVSQPPVLPKTPPLDPVPLPEPIAEPPPEPENVDDLVRIVREVLPAIPEEVARMVLREQYWSVDAAVAALM